MAIAYGGRAENMICRLRKAWHAEEPTAVHLRSDAAPPASVDAAILGRSRPDHRLPYRTAPAAPWWEPKI